MATQIYRLKGGAQATNLGSELLGSLEVLADAFARVERLAAAITQERDDTTDTATDFVTPAAVFGFVDGSGTVDAEVAMAAYFELQSFIAAAGPSLRQVCARLKQ